MGEGEIKVAVLTTELFPKFTGGLGVAIYEFYRAISILHPEVKPFIFLPRLRGNWKRMPFKVFELDYKIPELYGLPLFPFTEIPEEMEKFNRALAEFVIKKHKIHGFDVVHANDWLTAIAGVIIKQKTGVPLVLHIHSTEYDRTNYNPRKWVVEIEKAAMKAADLVIANSKRVKQQIVELYGIPPEKVAVVYNGINWAKYRKLPKARKPSKFVVLFIGRLTIMKGVWHLLHAAKKVIARNPEVLFVIVGSGPDFNYLVKTAIDLGITSNVMFLGRVSEREKLAALAAADVVVMPSVYEPFGIVALEAMASGKPCIVSKSSGVAEVINHCLKVDYWDIDRMASMLLELAAYPPLREVLGRKALEEARALGWDKAANALVETLKRVVKCPR